MALKLQTGLLKLFILLLLVQKMEAAVDADMTLMTTFSEATQSNMHKLTLYSGDSINLEGIYNTILGYHTSLTLISPTNQEQYVNMYQNSFWTWTVSQTGDFYLKINGLIGTTYRIKVIVNSNTTQELNLIGPHISRDSECLVRRLYTRSQCFIQIDTSAYFSAETRIRTSPQIGNQNTPRPIKLAAGSGQVVNFTLTNTMNISSYIFSFCGGFTNQATFSIPIYKRIGTECNFSIPYCGNNIIEFPQQCDNANAPGCKRCKIEENFICTENNDHSSSCTQIPIVCGNNMKQQGEQCDNGDQPGCVNCVIAAGYQCLASYNRSSICITKCGDGILAAGEQCDIGNQTGCVSCLVVQGYICQPSGGGSVCTLKIVQPAPASNNQGVSSPAFDTMQKLLQIIFPVSFVVLGLSGIVLFYNIAQIFIKSKTGGGGAMQIVNQDSSTIKKLDNNEVVQVKQYQ